MNGSFRTCSANRTTAVAAVGFGVPAFAAIASPGHVRQIAPTPVVSGASPDWTTTTIDDSSTSSIATLPTINVPVNNVEDVSGNCDEAEHVNDASCTGGGSETHDNSGPGNNNIVGDSGGDNSGSDDSGRGGDDG